MAFNPVTSDSVSTTKGNVLSQINQEFTDLYSELTLLQASLQNDIEEAVTEAKSEIAEDFEAYFTKVEINNQLAGKADLVLGKIPIIQLPDTILGQLKFETVYNASANSPVLPAAAGNKGSFWIVKTAGTVNGIGPAGANLTFGVGDWVLSVGTHYEQVDNTDSVITVFGRIGAITAQAGDYTTDQISETESRVFVSPAEKTKLQNSQEVSTTEKNTWNAKQSAFDAPTLAKIAAIDQPVSAAEKTTYLSKQDSLGWLNVKKAFGAKGDTLHVEAAASITSGSPTLTISGGTLTAADVGKSIIVHGAGAGGVKLLTTISGVTSATVCTLAAPASTTVSGRNVSYGTDDTAAIQAAINFVTTSQIGTLFFEEGIYWIGGALQTSVNGSNPNCQLYLPSIAITDHPVSIGLKGANPLPITFGVLSSVPTRRTGVTLYSPITGSGTRPSLLGGAGPAGGVAPGFTQATLTVDSVRFRTHFNLGAGDKGSSLNALNAMTVNWVQLDDVQADIDIRTFDTVQPSSTNSITGIILPRWNSGGSYAKNIRVIGYYIGMFVSEHSDVHDVMIGACDAAVVVGGNGTNGGYAVLAGRLLVCWCRKSIVAASTNYHADQAGVAAINFQQYTSEHYTLSYDPSNKWFTFVTDIEDTASNLRGKLNFDIHNSGGAPQSSITKVGATNLHTYPLYDSYNSVGPVVAYSQNFNGTAGVNINTLSPQIGSGQFESFAGTPADSGWLLDGSGGAVSQGTNARVSVGSQINNCKIEAQFSATFSADTQQVLFRTRLDSKDAVTQAQNFAIIRQNSTTYQISIVEFFGSATVPTTVTGTIPAATSFTVAITLSGTAATFTVNGVTINRNFTNPNSNTRHGFNALFAGVTMQDFKISTL